MGKHTKKHSQTTGETLKTNSTMEMLKASFIAAAMNFYNWSCFLEVPAHSLNLLCPGSTRSYLCACFLQLLNNCKDKHLTCPIDLCTTSMTSVCIAFLLRAGPSQSCRCCASFTMQWLTSCSSNSRS